MKAQREKGRRGFMAGIDVKLAKQEERALARSAALAEREERYTCSARTAVATEVYLLLKSSDGETSSDSSEKEPEPSTSAWPPKQ